MVARKRTRLSRNLHETSRENDDTISLVDAIVSNIVETSGNLLLFNPYVRISYAYETKIPNHIKKQFSADKFVEGVLQPTLTEPSGFNRSVSMIAPFEQVISSSQSLRKQISSVDMTEEYVTSTPPSFISFTKIMEDGRQRSSTIEDKGYSSHGEKTPTKPRAEKSRFSLNLATVFEATGLQEGRRSHSKREARTSISSDWEDETSSSPRKKHPKKIVRKSSLTNTRSVIEKKSSQTKLTDKKSKRSSQKSEGEETSSAESF